MWPDGRLGLLAGRWVSKADAGPPRRPDEDVGAAKALALEPAETTETEFAALTDWLVFDGPVAKLPCDRS